MTFLPLALATTVILLVAYRIYGTFLGRLFELDANRQTPARELRDDIDYIPTEARFLIGQHFSAIAAAGPIVGPILAGKMFGWLPALLWILVGSIFMGGVHDFTSLVASIRHRARSMAEVVKENMSYRSYVLFLTFIWLALIYIIVAFTDLTAQSFVGKQVLENGEVVTGAGIASASAMYLVLPLIMGLLLRYTRLGLTTLTAVFLPLILVVIWLGQQLPIDLETLFALSETEAHKIWDVLILAYCLVAAVSPVWLLLQPRGHLGGFFLYFFLAAGILGLLFGGHAVRYPAFTGWTSPAGDTLAPILFITIACGAVSGFHSLIASGTTSKQLHTETDAKLIGYGTMLMEAGVAFIALSCVMMLGPDDALLKKSPNLIFASGVGSFLQEVGVPSQFAISLMLMAFTTFVYDTLDICTRLGRYIVQELTGLQSSAGRWLGTTLTAGVPLFFVTRTLTNAKGDIVPAWQLFWPLFGASNQLLAALSLLGITIWLWNSPGSRLRCVVTGIPCIFMYLMSCWALTNMVSASYSNPASSGAILWIGMGLLSLAILMLIEAALLLYAGIAPPGNAGMAPGPQASL
jgi:carbon starvation protein